MLRYRLFLLFVLLHLFSCTKDELTQPVSAELLLELVPAEDQGFTPAPLEVTGGRFIISALGFDGYRENGENYFFTRQFPDSLEITFTRHQTASVLHFEMPQGIYSRIDVKLDVPAGREGSANAEEGVRTGFKGGIELWGNYTTNQEEQVPFIFVYTALDEFRFTAQSAAGVEEVVVQDNRLQQAILRFNPGLWMELINPQMLQSARLSLLDGVPTIIISKTSNNHIYNLLANRIQQSAGLEFK